MKKITSRILIGLGIVIIITGILYGGYVGGLMFSIPAIFLFIIATTKWDLKKIVRDALNFKQTSKHIKRKIKTNKPPEMWGKWIGFFIFLVIGWVIAGMGASYETEHGYSGVDLKAMIVIFTFLLFGYFIGWGIHASVISIKNLIKKIRK